MNKYLNDSSFCTLNFEIADRKLIFIDELSFLPIFTQRNKVADKKSLNNEAHL
jgi:hypothetical protein